MRAIRVRAGIFPQKDHPKQKSQPMVHELKSFIPKSQRGVGLLPSLWLEGSFPAVCGTMVCCRVGLEVFPCPKVDG